ncbi:MAG: DNA polymerase III subunit chi [Gammaproteobacteria bacterium]|nr:DNA polymerase III subunit chi [Gammaproteobacteria bacterium]MCW8910685.1 DNA polymerase III subunit chi [Gammaproteobacteria bacterium]MCW9005754.1 DNA polymerase III subunit chi [Gammaproteobacteria bacterium]MCW9056141.1 DNA polymerase III subunit chi [Gammaproteobacteria bacterium]
MTRVDFYILQDQNPLSLQKFACRLADKAYQQGHRILIQTETAEESRILDNMLWTISENSFLPHTIDTGSANDDQPIIISHQAAEYKDFQTMINLSSITPVDTRAFDRIAEILNQQESRKQTGREHYKIYKARGYELYHHEIK